MQTLIIKGEPGKALESLIAFAHKLGFKADVISDDPEYPYNKETINAIKELRAGKGLEAKDIGDFKKQTGI
jgi:hypothetical protein